MWLKTKSTFPPVVLFWHTHRPRTAEASGIFTTTGRILFYNSWKENFGKLQMHCSEFHEWLIHLNRNHGWFLLPLQFSTGPSKLFKFPEIVRPPPSLDALCSGSRVLVYAQPLARVCSRMLAYGMGVCIHPRLVACIEKVYTLVLNVRICVFDNL